MPLPRKSSPRRRERRSRSRSYSPRSSRRRSRSRSGSPSRSGRDRRRSRSTERKRSPERKYRSPRRSHSPRRSRSPKHRSKTPKRRSRSDSLRRKSPTSRRVSSPRRRVSSPRRKSPSPGHYPVKRPADSSVKRQSYRSLSPSPVKRSREERVYRDESPVEKLKYGRHSSSPESHGKSHRTLYSDQPSASKKPLFPAASPKAEIDFVTILEKGQKKEKLNKRFETLEQVAHGPFDFEENITIGIHRGPQHIELDDDEEIEISYEFNPKTFKMLFPKKDHAKAIFDRDEIKAFRHDEILDEEAYVEKRTISVKPVEKPKSKKYSDEFDYKVTVDRDKEGYEDRRMVRDSRAGSRPTRSSYYEDIPVTVRLDPKPDPRYEKIYRDQQRFEDKTLMQEKMQRNPNDLRYNLMRRKSDGDREHGMMDARSRIEARRLESHGDEYRDRPGERRVSSLERKKPSQQTELPDFKNRPEKFKEPEWKVNPLITPKGLSYYEHDSRSRDDMTYWERKQMFLKTGRYPSRRGFRGRGFRGPGRGRGFVPGFQQRSSGGAMEEWKHDKFDEVKNEDEPKEKKESKEKKSDRKESKDVKRDKVRYSGKSTKREFSSNKRENPQAEKNHERSAVKREEESLKNELKVEVMIG